MKYKEIISDRAKEMLGIHLPFMTQVNKPASQKLKTRLIQEICFLEEFPEKYPFFNENYIPANKYHKLYVENWYLLLYQIKDNMVYVDWMVDCRQDYQWLLR